MKPNRSDGVNKVNQARANLLYAFGVYVSRMKRRRQQATAFAQNVTEQAAKGDWRWRCAAGRR